MSQYGALRVRQARHGLPRRSSRHYYHGHRAAAPSTHRADRARPAADDAAPCASSGVRRIAGGRHARPRRRRTPPAASASQIVLRTSAGKSIGRFAAPLRLVGADGGLRLLGRAGNGVARRQLPRRPRAAPGSVGRERHQRASASRATSAASSPPRARPRGRPRRCRRRPSPRAPTRSRRTSPARASTTTPTRARRSTTAMRAEYPSTDAAVARDGAARSSPTRASRSSRTSSPPPAGAPRTSRTPSSAPTRKPWLKSVEDPYDSESPRHRWGPYRWTARAGRSAGSAAG